jgi:sulfatase modifying factor 1
MEKITRIIVATVLLLSSVNGFAQDSNGDYNSANIGVLKFIPSGQFINGVSNVKISSFRIGEAEITQKQYQLISGENPSKFIIDPNHDNFPVEQVSWYDAVKFCNLLSIKENLKPAYSINGTTDPFKWGIAPKAMGSDWDNIILDISANGYRLPTEAEWEYASRAGTTTRFYWGDSDEYNVVSKYALYADNIYRSGVSTIAVKQKLPNSWGLYDTASNVWEWCWDWWGDLPKNELQDPTGPQNGPSRIQRGGGWNGNSGLSPLKRAGNQPNLILFNVGFRVVRR